MIDFEQVGPYLNDQLWKRLIWSVYFTLDRVPFVLQRGVNMGIRLELLFVCISNRHTQVLGCPRNGRCIDAPLNMHKPGTNRLCFISTCFYSVFSN